MLVTAILCPQTLQGFIQDFFRITVDYFWLLVAFVDCCLLRFTCCWLCLITVWIPGVHSGFQGGSLERILIYKGWTSLERIGFPQSLDLLLRSLMTTLLLLLWWLLLLLVVVVVVVLVLLSLLLLLLLLLSLLLFVVLWTLSPALSPADSYPKDQIRLCLAIGWY